MMHLLSDTMPLIPEKGRAVVWIRERAHGAPQLDTNTPRSYLTSAWGIRRCVDARHNLPSGAPKTGWIETELETQS